MLRGHATLVHLVGKRRKLHPSVFSFGADENVCNANVSSCHIFSPLTSFLAIESFLKFDLHIHVVISSLVLLRIWG